MTSYDIVIVGGGPAGLAAAASARRNGIDSILIIERDSELGGILNQCIHNGFGLHTFKEELTGPEYAYRFIEQVCGMGIEYRLDTMVMDISRDRVVTAMNRTDGMFQIKAGAVILAMGCRERPRGALNIPGFRPAGIYSAGTAQRLVNIEGYMPGREVVILGSGDIGLIMARRMTLEGAIVKVVAELMPYSGGLKRNIVQCLDDFGIPLRLSHTVVDIEGKERVSAVTIAEVGPDRKPIPGTEERYTCDTLLLSTGLIPENELSRSCGVEINPVTGGPYVNEILETSIPGVFACGNVLHVHDLVDYVSEEAAQAGAGAAKYVRKGSADNRTNAGAGENTGVDVNTGTDAQEDIKKEMGAAANAHADTEKETNDQIRLIATDGVRYTVPSTIHPSRMDDKLIVRFRVGDVFKNSFVSVYFDGDRVQHRRKKIMAPGEMEQVILQKKQIEEKSGMKTITVKIEAD